jgi:hypothetical protein
VMIGRAGAIDRDFAMLRQELTRALQRVSQ